MDARSVPKTDARGVPKMDARSVLVIYLHQPKYDVVVQVGFLYEQLTSISDWCFISF